MRLIHIIELLVTIRDVTVYWCASWPDRRCNLPDNIDNNTHSQNLHTKYIIDTGTIIVHTITIIHSSNL